MSPVLHTLDYLGGEINAGRCVPVIGAGVSIPAGAESWLAHLKKLADKVPEPYASLSRQPSLDATEVTTILQSKRRELGLPPVHVRLSAPGVLHKILANWKCPLYLTTNFDDGLEHAVREQGGEPRVYRADELKTFDLNTVMRAQAEIWTPAIVKLCSTHRQDNPGIETREDFAQLINGNLGALDLLETTIRAYTVLFVGCSMGDPLLNAAIDKCYAGKMGYSSPIVLIPDDAPKQRLAALEARGVRVQRFQSDDKNRRLQELLESWRALSEGPHRLLLFQPGSITKLNQILAAIEKVRKSAGFGALGLITTDRTIREVFTAWAERQDPPVLVVNFPVRRIDNTDEVMEKVVSSPLRWTALLAPYEFATGHAAVFADQYKSRINRDLRFHSIGSSIASRDKRKFRSLMDTLSLSGVVRSTAWEEITVRSDSEARDVLKMVRASSPGRKHSQLVLKPRNAGGSIGVRPLDLVDDVGSELQISDLIRVLRSMPLDPETASCDTSTVLIEERLPGEEFSIESRKSDHSVEVFAIHWKVDIDADKTRFFERLFVTLPHGFPDIFSLLETANKDVLEAMQVGTGVFHSEFRIDQNYQAAYPLEVGLRPGGGMVNNSVRGYCGVDLFEAAVRCAIGVEGNRPHDRTVVATGLVFASSSGGVMPSLRFHDGITVRSLVHGDTVSVLERLRRLTETTNRHEAKQLLAKIINRSNPICDRVIQAFDPDGFGLKADVDLVEIWGQPGDLVAEEEATYVAGIRATARRDISPECAMAEAVAAVQLCLDRIRCEPETPLQTFAWRSYHVESEKPHFWVQSENSRFRSEIDSWVFSRGLLLARSLSIASVLDLGCGSAKPGIALARTGVSYVGVDIQEDALDVARANLARNKLPLTVYHADVLGEGWCHEIADLRTIARDAVVANLPYLPCAQDLQMPIEVDGGSDGLRFVPDVVLKTADHVGASHVVINISSLANIGEFGRKVTAAGFAIVRIVACIAPLEEYAQRCLPYLRAHTFPQIYGPESDSRQVIFAVTLSRTQGISCATTFSQIPLILKPDVNPIGTIVEGVANW